MFLFQFEFDLDLDFRYCQVRQGLIVLWVVKT
jgi:hypothetical protein